MFPPFHYDRSLSPISDSTQAIERMQISSPAAQTELRNFSTHPINNFTNSVDKENAAVSLNVDDERSYEGHSKKVSRCTSEGFAGRSKSPLGFFLLECDDELPYELHSKKVSRHDREHSSDDEPKPLPLRLKSTSKKFTNPSLPSRPSSAPASDFLRTCISSTSIVGSSRPVVTDCRMIPLHRCSSEYTMQPICRSASPVPFDFPPPGGLEHRKREMAQPVFKKGCILPTIRGGAEDLNNINAHTVGQLLRGEYDDQIDEFYIFDCRYPYEYRGGHIRGACLAPSSEKLREVFFDHPIVDRVVAFVFHCEFSVQRGPAAARDMRRVDRELNAANYPELYYPQVYLLAGGYKDFFSTHKTCCSPMSYVRMRAPSCTKEFQECLKSRPLKATTRSRSLGSQAMLEYFQRGGHIPSPPPDECLVQNGASRIKRIRSSDNIKNIHMCSMETCEKISPAGGGWLNRSIRDTSNQRTVVKVGAREVLLPNRLTRSAPAAVSDCVSSPTLEDQSDDSLDNVDPKLCACMAGTSSVEVKEPVAYWPAVHSAPAEEPSGENDPMSSPRTA